MTGRLFSANSTPVRAWYLLSHGPGAHTDGVPMPEGTRVWTSQGVTQRHARWFCEPEELRPERWNPEKGDAIAEYA